MNSAQTAESDARRRLEQAQDDLERAQRRGERAEKAAKDAAKAAAGAFEGVAGGSPAAAVFGGSPTAIEGEVLARVRAGDYSVLDDRPDELPARGHAAGDRRRDGQGRRRGGDRRRRPHDRRDGRHRRPLRPRRGGRDRLLQPARRQGRARLRVQHGLLPPPGRGLGQPGARADDGPVRHPARDGDPVRRAEERLHRRLPAPRPQAARAARRPQRAEGVRDGGPGRQLLERLPRRRGQGNPDHAARPGQRGHPGARRDLRAPGPHELHRRQPGGGGNAAGRQARAREPLHERVGAAQLRAALHRRRRGARRADQRRRPRAARHQPVAGQRRRPRGHPVGAAVRRAPRRQGQARAGDDPRRPHRRLRARGDRSRRARPGRAAARLDRRPHVRGGPRVPQGAHRGRRHADGRRGTSSPTGSPTTSTRPAPRATSVTPSGQAPCRR